MIENGSYKVSPLISYCSSHMNSMEKSILSWRKFSSSLKHSLFDYCSSWKRDPHSWEVKKFWFWSVTPRPVWLMEENKGEVKASLVAQLIKKLPVMQDTWVQSLDQEDPLEEEWKPILVFLPGKSHGQKNLSRYSPWVTWFGHNLATKPPPCGGMNDLVNLLYQHVDANFVYKLEAGWS